MPTMHSIAPTSPTIEATIIETYFANNPFFLRHAVGLDEKSKWRLVLAGVAWCHGAWPLSFVLGRRLSGGPGDGAGEKSVMPKGAHGQGGQTRPGPTYPTPPTWGARAPVAPTSSSLGMPGGEAATGSVRPTKFLAGVLPAGLPPAVPVYSNRHDWN